MADARKPVRDGSSSAPAAAMVLGAIASIQIGAATATGLFEQIGPGGVVFLRAAASAVLLAVIWRPSFRIPRESRRLTVVFGIALAGMNLCFYEAIDRIPLGVAVTFEFTGPLTVALITSGRRRDLIWVALAAAGILLLSGGVGDTSLDPWGVVLAFMAGAFWGSYILLGKRMGERSPGGQGLAVAMTISALICAPIGIADGGSSLLEPSVLALGLVIGVLSSALPFSLELEAMRRLPSNVFGVMMSLEPAIAATVGFVLLSQGMGVAEIVAILLVVAASAGALWSSRAPAPIEP